MGDEEGGRNSNRNEKQKKIDNGFPVDDKRAKVTGGEKKKNCSTNTTVRKLLKIPTTS